MFCLCFNNFRRNIQLNRINIVNIRGLAVIAVLFIHIIAPNITEQSSISVDTSFILIDSLARFAVPVFFISSGFGISSIYKRYKSVLEFYISRIKLLPDFLIWTILYFSLNGFYLTTSSIAKALIGRSFYHMYFIPALLICYLIFPFVQKFLSNKLILILLIFLGLIIQFLYYIGFKIPYFEWIGFIPYFLTGIFFEKNKKIYYVLQKFATLILVIGLLTLLGTTFYDIFFTDKKIFLIANSLKPSVFLYSIGMVLFFTKYFPKPVKLLNKLDFNSMNIYYVHPLIIDILLKINPNLLNFNNLIILIFVVSLVLVISYIVSMIINTIKVFSSIKK